MKIFYDKYLPGIVFLSKDKNKRLLFSHGHTLQTKQAFILAGVELFNYAGCISGMEKTLNIIHLRFLKFYFSITFEWRKSTGVWSY